MSNKLKKTGTNKTNKSMEEIKKSNDILKKEVSELIDAEVEKRVAAGMEVIKKEMLNAMFAIPMLVLKENFWQKSFNGHNRLPLFADYMLEYYKKWDRDEISSDEINNTLWAYGGIKFNSDLRDQV